MSNNMSAAVLKITICFSSVCCIILLMTGCNKVADIKIVKNSTVLKNEIHKDSFIYELNIYNAKGKLSIYRLSSFKPLIIRPFIAKAIRRAMSGVCGRGERRLFHYSNAYAVNFV